MSDSDGDGGTAGHTAFAAMTSDRFASRSWSSVNSLVSVKR
jgi:hypothetical protein